MKKIVLEVIKLVVLTIALNIILNVIKYMFDLQINEIGSYVIYAIKHLCIICMGVNILWEDLDLQTVKKITICFTIVIVVYNIFYTVKAIVESEELLANDTSQSTFQYDDSLTERENEEIKEFMETLEGASQNLKQYLEEGKGEYYAQLFRIYVIIFNIITAALYCFVAPKWFDLQE